MAYINFNDESQPIGKRKQAYVKWAVSKGTSLIDAQRQANKKFGFEKKGKVVAIVYDMFCPHYVEDIFDCYYDIRKLKEYKVFYAERNGNILLTEDEVNDIKTRYKANGWKILVRHMVG